MGKWSSRVLRTMLGEIISEVSAAHLQLLDFQDKKMECCHQAIYFKFFFLVRIQLRSGLAVDDSQHVQDRWWIIAMRRKLRATAGHGPWPPACALRPSPGFPGDARGCTCTCWTSFVDLWGSPRCHGLSFHRLVPGVADQLSWFRAFFDLDRTACKASLISLGSALKIESYLQDLQNEAGHDISHLLDAL